MGAPLNDGACSECDDPSCPCPQGCCGGGAPSYLEGDIEIQCTSCDLCGTEAADGDDDVGGHDDFYVPSYGGGSDSYYYASAP